MKKPNIRIFQVYFAPKHKKFLSPVFAPYFNDISDEFYEAGIFWREFKKGSHLLSDYTGYVSWKFEKKSFVEAQEFLDLAMIEPGKDVYFLNPFPELVGEFKNVWLQGAASHPGLLDLAQRVFQHVGLKVDLLQFENSPTDVLYCNYWYGSKHFWQEFMAFCAPFYDLFQNPSSDFYTEIRASAKYHGGGTLIPFFMERIFSTFLSLRSDISRSSYQWDLSRQNQVIRLMRHQLNLSEAKLDEILHWEENATVFQRLKKFYHSTRSRKSKVIES